MITDPRPDLPDATRWAIVLGLAYQFDKASQVFGAILAARCMGVHLEATKSTLRLLPPAEDTHPSWDEFRRDYLLPYREQIADILARARRACP